MLSCTGCCIFKAMITGGCASTVLVWHAATSAAMASDRHMTHSGGPVGSESAQTPQSLRSDAARPTPPVVALCRTVIRLIDGDLILPTALIAQLPTHVASRTDNAAFDIITCSGLLRLPCGWRHAERGGFLEHVSFSECVGVSERNCSFGACFRVSDRVSFGILVRHDVVVYLSIAGHTVTGMVVYRYADRDFNAFPWGVAQRI